MNKNDMLQNESKEHSDHLKLLLAWIEEEELFTKKIQGFIEALPDNFEFPNKITRGLMSMTFIYPLDKKLINRVSRSLKSLFSPEKFGEIRVESYQASFYVRLDEISITLSFQSGEIGSNCELVKIGEEKVERIVPIYSMECI